MARDGTDRIRSIDPGFWTHPKTLAVMEEDTVAVLLLLGIRSSPIDDDGRFRADPLSLKAKLLSVSSPATVEWVETALVLLEKHRLLHLYECEGTRYGVIHDWKDWQKVERPHESVMPAPPRCLCRCCNSGRKSLAKRRVGYSPTSHRDVADISPTCQAESPQEGSGSRSGSGKVGEGGTDVAAVADTTGTPASVRPTWPAEMAALQSIDGYPFDEKKDSKLMDALAEGYPLIDLAAEIRKLKAWAEGRGMLPLRGKGAPRRRLRNWIAKAEEFAGSRPAPRTGPQERNRRPAAAPAPASAFTETGEIKL